MFRYFCLMITNLFFLIGLALSVNANTATYACGSARIEINEVNYVAAGDAEFVEFYADDGNLPLDGLELRLVGADGRSYGSHSLDNHTMSDLGFFLVKGSGVIDFPTELDAMAVLEVDQADLIADEEPGGIGIYDTALDNYCSFVNYGGSVEGETFRDYLQIGRDRSSDGEYRSCSRHSAIFGDWGCDRVSTPNAANGIVSVTFNQTSVANGQTTSTFIILLSILSLSIPFARYAKQSRVTIHN